MRVEISGINLEIAELSDNVNVVVVPYENEMYTSLELAVGQWVKFLVPYVENKIEMTLHVDDKRVRETVIYPAGENSKSVPYESTHGVGSEICLMRSRYYVRN